MYKGYKLANALRNRSIYKTSLFSICTLYSGFLSCLSILGGYCLFKVLHVEDGDYFHRRMISDPLIDEIRKKMLAAQNMEE